MAKNRQSLLNGVSEISSDKQKIDNDLRFSFKHLDTTQGQTFQDWQTEGILADALETMRGYCTQTLGKAVSKKFSIYNNFPPKSDFHHPKHVSPEACWARIHISGLRCLGGHIVHNTFYVVFLDKNHRFFISEP